MSNDKRSEYHTPTDRHAWCNHHTRSQDIKIEIVVATGDAYWSSSSALLATLGSGSQPCT